MCEYLNDNNQREIFVDTIREKLIGPGADIFGIGKEEELISKNPTKLYYSGILFSSAYSNPDMIEQSPDVTEEPELQVVPDGPGAPLVTELTDENKKDYSKEDEEAARQSKQTFFPKRCGLVFALKEEAEEIKVTFQYATYKESDVRKIKLTQEENTKLSEILQTIESDQNLQARYGPNFFTFNQNFNYDPDTEILTLNRVPFILNDEEEISIFKDAAFNALYYPEFSDDSFLRVKFHKLCHTIYQRNASDVAVNINLTVDNNNDGLEIEGTNLKYYVKIIPRNGNKIIKILLQNDSVAEKKSYKDCYFQVKIKVDSTHLTNYHQPINSVIDEDFSTVEYQYQDVHSYGKGINCAVSWKENESIETTFLPETDINSFSNDEKEEIVDAGISDIFELKNLSIWTELPDNEIIEKLKTFVATYQSWINDQEAISINDGNPIIAQNLIQLQQTAKERLDNNIAYLEQNPEAFTCFKLANTAMMIQMIVAKDDRFRKGREWNEYNAPDNYFNNIEFFDNYDKPSPKYRPFQLAFLLMNIESTFDKTSVDRNELVDLIWFPTGGGKTEAYLALTALTIIERRRNNQGKDTTGVSVMMRYTLRLLTAQQFERATWLICALEFLRKQFINDNEKQIGNEQITIGMWVGQSTTPNSLDELDVIPNNNSQFKQIFQNLNIPVNAHFTLQRKLERVNDSNKFPLSYCPWCGCNLITIMEDSISNGYNRDNGLDLICNNGSCFYNGDAEQNLPVFFIDEQIYNNPPTLLFATVDKMVRLSHIDNAGKLFNRALPPDLIIQDELHLLSGPLGTLCGLYEVVIDQLCTSNDGRKPKIVASTATTRNTQSVIKAMYNRKLNIFPAQGVQFNDNFFSYVDKNSKRKHIGVMPTGKTAGTTEIKLVECLYEAKIKLLKCFLEHHNIDLNNLDALLNKLNDADFKKDVDPYWTFVLYYNNLRDLGRSKTRVGVDFKDQIKGLFVNKGFDKIFEFVFHGIEQRNVEFTSRQESGKIKALLTRTETPVCFVKSNDGTRIFEDNQNSIDLALASNMFSVGIDVNRLNLMLMMGQPGSNSEYIQSSSRVARKDKGLVINLLNPMRPREMSVFEDYTAFHKSYYKNVEPLSITPFAEMAIDKLLDAVLVAFTRQVKNTQASQFTNAISNALSDIMQHRISSLEQRAYVTQKLNEMATQWRNKIDGHTPPSQILFKRNIHNKQPFLVSDMMNSLRDIEEDVYIENADLT